MIPPPAGSFRRREVLFVLTSTMVVVLMGMSIMVPVLPLYAQSFGVGSAMVGMVVACFGLGRILTDMPSGHWSERFGRRPFIVAGPAIFTVASFLCGLAPNFWVLIFFRFIQGMGSALYTTSAMTVLTDISSREDRGRVFSLYQGTVLLGTGLGPTVGGLVAEWYGMQSPFFLSAFLSLVATVWAFLRIPETRPAVEDGDASIGHAGRKAEKAGVLRSLFLNVNFLLVGMIAFGLHFTQTGARQTIVPLLGYGELGLSAAQIGFALTIVTVIDFVVIFIGGMVSDRFGRKVVIVPAFAVTAASLVLFTVGHSYALFLLSAAVFGLGRGIMGAAPMAFAADIAGERSHGLVSGLYRTFADAGLMAGPVSLGWIADASSFSWALYANAGMLLVFTLLFGVMAREATGGPVAEAALAEVDG